MICEQLCRDPASTGRPPIVDHDMTTTTPESRARLAYAAYTKTLLQAGLPVPPPFDQLPEAEHDAWMNAARVLWELATTGQSTL